MVEVAEHNGKRESFPEVSFGNLRTEVLAVTTGDYQAFQSRIEVLKEIMVSLKDSNIQRIGVFGIGGVGKTTLVKEVYKQASENKVLFDDVVILLDVKKDPNPEVIQKKIVEKLGMEILANETIDGRASRLCARIKDRKVLVILDDVHEKIDMEAVGVPRLPTCKILVTCRTRDVLSLNEMRADKDFQLHLLTEEETCSLFERMIGDIVKPCGRIRDVAIKVAEKCGSLPLLVSTVANALKGKDKLGDWQDALRQLTGFDGEDLTEKEYLALKWSYHQLDDRMLKPLFLLSGIIVHQNHIDAQNLLRYGIGLGLFTSLTLEQARNALGRRLRKLKDSCLLLETETEGIFRMHDLVCHVANRIAYSDYHMLSVEYGKEFKEWPNQDFLRECTRICIVQESIPTLDPEVPMDCPKLEMLYLHITKYGIPVRIPSNFFTKMGNLKILDVTYMNMPTLPLSLQYLKELQTLCLDHCRLEDITRLGQLTSLEILSFSNSILEQIA